jgi:tRNA uridine 5-carbamoylmethylation protein Kti12
MKTLIVNAFGGPGVGKTTCCWHIASELKKRGILTEYVSEYAKELVYEEKFDLLDDSMYGQTIIFHEQKRRLDRLIGKVKVVVTDSPILLSIIYASDATEDFKKKILDKFNSYDNFNLVVLRDDKKEYQQSGRKETLEESKEKDKEICKLLDDNKIYYGSYSHEKMDLIIDNIIKTYNRIQ